MWTLTMTMTLTLTLTIRVEFGNPFLHVGLPRWHVDFDFDFDVGVERVFHVPR
jgi:hypothetical protein